MEERQRELLLFQLGPVQEFIAQAETVGDLRAGSELLSELTAAALEVIPAYETEAVFPAVKRGELKGIPNRFLVFVPQGEGKRLAEKAAAAAQEGLMALAEACWPKLEGVPRERHEAYRAQVRAFLQTTWAVLKIPSGNMGADYKAIGKLMAMRRSTRQFDAWHEEVCAAVKDFLSGKEAALDVADDKAPNGDKAPNRNSGRGAMNLIKALRAKAEEDEMGKWRERFKDDDYIAVIAMDGDHMGEKLSGFKTREEHRKFSEKLAGFASSVTVNAEDGVLIYAGGDDVLAVVKAPQAFELAKQWAGKFTETIGEDGVTASAGIAIGSVKAPLQDLIHEAHAAESRAKYVYGRDALAVSVLKRSGEILKWGCGWGSKALVIYDALKDKGDALADFAHKLAGFLKPYELGRLGAGGWTDMKPVVLAETLHAWKRATGAEEALDRKLIETYLGEEKVKSHPEDFLGLVLCEDFINRPRD